jgi:hypothetical protein
LEPANGKSLRVLDGREARDTTESTLLQSVESSEKQKRTLPRRPQQRTSTHGEVASGSDSDTDLSFRGSNTLSHDEAWRSLGSFIDDISGNKPVRGSTVKFGMEVIESEYAGMIGQGGKNPPSLSRAKAQICKAVRAGLRTKSLPNLYVRVEDPCNAVLAKRTEAREAQANDEEALALRFTKRRDRLAKKATKLENRISALKEDLDQVPADVYSIHPDLQFDLPPPNEGSDRREKSRDASQAIKVRPAPAGTVSAFLGAVLSPGAN